MTNLDDKKCKISHWVSLSIDRNTTAYFDSFGIEYIPQEVLNIIRDKSITLNIFIIQDNHSLRCGFYCVAFIEYKIAGKILLDYLNLFSQNDYKKNEKKKIIILRINMLSLKFTLIKKLMKQEIMS